MKQTALITGASSGIGLEFANIFARHGYQLILVARNEGRLQTFANELERNVGITPLILIKDLSRPASASEIFGEVMAKGIQVDVLVNNAGAGLSGRFTDNDLEAELGILQLNIVSLAALCHLFGKDMAQRGRGRILNVASTAAFQPGPMMANYYASKAYVLSLSEGIRDELKKSGVIVTALCPGPTKTGFFTNANMLNTLMARAPHILSARQVAERGYKALVRGERVTVVGLANKVMAFSTRFAPRSLLAMIAGTFNTRPSP